MKKMVLDRNCKRQHFKNLSLSLENLVNRQLPSTLANMVYIFVTSSIVETFIKVICCGHIICQFSCFIVELIVFKCVLKCIKRKFSKQPFPSSELICTVAVRNLEKSVQGTSCKNTRSIEQLWQKIQMIYIYIQILKILK